MPKSLISGPALFGNRLLENLTYNKQHTIKLLV